nr:DUF998 domain-containing protein [Chloroflexota bacterium]
MTRKSFLRVAGLCGVIAPVVSLGMIFFAVAISPWFNWHTNALSDLGVHPGTAGWFNAALIIGGVLTATLAIGVGQWIGPGWIGYCGTAAAFIGAVGLIGVGVFPENYGGVHWYAAATYFLITPVGYVLLGAATWCKGQRVHGALTIAAGIGAFLAIMGVPHNGLAVPEIVATLILTSRVFATGMRLLLE